MIRSKAKCVHGTIKLVNINKYVKLLQIRNTALLAYRKLTVKLSRALQHYHAVHGYTLYPSVAISSADFGRDDDGVKDGDACSVPNTACGGHSGANDCCTGGC